MNNNWRRDLIRLSRRSGASELLPFHVTAQLQVGDADPVSARQNFDHRTR
jgi:hypothetical protein